MELIDIGVNLTSGQFRKDQAEVIERATQAGISHMIVTGTTLEHSLKAAKLSISHQNGMYSTAGVHPHHAKDFDQSTHQQILELSQHEKVVAVGECGLDYNRNFSPEAEQLSCYDAQLEIAVETKLPVFMHQRDAHQAFIDVLKKHRPNLTNGVVHCFTGSGVELDEYLALDLHIGITGWICDERRGKELQAIVDRIPLNRLMIETDAPYLMPRNMEPMPKSKRNEPAYLPQVCKTLARCMQVDIEELAQATTKTAKTFFKL